MEKRPKTSESGRGIPPNHKHSAAKTAASDINSFIRGRKQVIEVLEASRPRTGYSAVFWGVALVSLAPFIFYLPLFRKLFFFGDEWDQLAEMAALGIQRWALLPFGENVVPLFKVLWGGAVIVSHGSYLFLLALVWLTHLAITVTLGSILRSIGFGVFPVSAAMLICALPWSNIETLAWSVQWAPMLATFFFLVSWRLLIHIVHTNKWTGLTIAKIGLYGALVTASALCFARGVIVGPVLASFVMLSNWEGVLPVVKRAILMTSCAVPVLLAMLVYAPVIMTTASQGQQLQGHFGAVVEFATGAFLLNPLFRIASWEMPLIGLSVAIILGLFKIATVFSGFSQSRKSREQVAFLAALLLFDIVNCALLGVGRYQTGFQSTVASRYQYLALICLAPFIGLLMARLLVNHSSWLDKSTAFALLLAWCALSTYRWPQELRVWSAWRGTEVRSAITLKGHPVEGFASSLQNSVHAAELQAKYNLH